jgi:type II secretory pathway component PulM
MKGLFDRLNLRPQERRLVVIVGMVVFVLLNMWFVWPYFGDWGKTQADLQRNRATLARYQSEIGRRTQYERKVSELESTGSEMLASENQFQSIISAQAAATSVGVSSILPGRSTSTRTNQFFQEGSLSVQFTSGGKEIVDFLVAIAAQNAMIRVRDMSIHPDQNQTRLAGNIVFVGNYQKILSNGFAAPRTAAPNTAAPKTAPKQTPKTAPKTAPSSNSKVAPPPARKNT